jgi:hypothetical protein
MSRPHTPPLLRAGAGDLCCTRAQMRRLKRDSEAGQSMAAMDLTTPTARAPAVEEPT